VQWVMQGPLHVIAKGHRATSGLQALH
jgi:hypothetical protein